MARRVLSKFLLLASIGVFLGAASPMAEVAPEYAIKAVFLYNLLKYADWPPGSPLSDPSKPVVLAVVGDDPFGALIDEAVRDRTVRGRPIVVVRAPDLKSIKSVHVAFICASEAARANQLVRVLAERSALTVGDTSGAAHGGVVVNFVMVQGRVRFDVNQTAAKRSGIDLSSHFLKLARHISETD